MTALSWTLYSVGGLTALTGIFCLVDRLMTRRAPRPLDPFVTRCLRHPHLKEHRKLDEGGFDADH